MPSEAITARTVTVQGVEVPRLGVGTAQLWDGAAYDAVLDALALGYRLIDAARMYGNEDEVGRALAESGIPREQIFLTTKVAREEAAAGALERAFAEQLADLRTDHVDLLLLHWPSEPPLEETLGAMVALREQGAARQIGVSNFPSALLRRALELALLFCNQVEYHAYLSQRPILDLCREHDLLLMAYSPFAQGQLHDEPVLKEIGAAHGRSAGQVALRWLLEQPGVATIPRSSSHARRAENLDVFDFALTDEERARVERLTERGVRNTNPAYAPAWD